jgi:hypothetical protein
MADKSPKALPKNPIKPESGFETDTNRLIWFERARAMNIYEDAVKQADNKALYLFGLIHDQMQQQFKLSLALYMTLIISSLIVLTISLFIVFISTSDAYLHSFSLIGIPVSILALLVALLRNPLILQKYQMDSILKLNIVFLSFVRRTQQTDLLLQSLFYESDPLEFTKIYSLIHDFQNVVDETMEEIDQINLS